MIAGEKLVCSFAQFSAFKNYTSYKDEHDVFGYINEIHSKKRTTCSGLMKTALNNVLLPTLFKVVNNTEQVDEPELACSQV